MRNGEACRWILFASGIGIGWATGAYLPCQSPPFKATEVALSDAPTNESLVILMVVFLRPQREARSWRMDSEWAMGMLEIFFFCSLQVLRRSQIGIRTLNLSREMPQGFLCHMTSFLQNALDPGALFEALSGEKRRDGLVGGCVICFGGKRRPRQR